jgi:predicted AlkP superfamily pyrophosphatase or phosphodiesterase
MERIRPFARTSPPRMLAAVLVLLAGLAAASARAQTPSSVILISLDGTRPVDLEDPQLTTIAELRRRGARASKLIPVFPTNTFPNHITLVTGVHPDVHGIVDNAFVDPERGEFDKSSDPSWLLAEPLWSLVARHGIVSASYHWAGSEGPWTSGRGPRDWKPFDEEVLEDAKVEQILAWLGGPEPRPRLVTAWFRGADRASHRTGVGTPRVREVLRRQDEALGRLVAALDARGAFAHTTLLIVSDHGMAPLRRRVDLQAALRAAGVVGKVYGAGGTVTVKVEPGRGFVDATLTAAHRIGLAAWPREDTPGELRARHPRLGDVVVSAPVGVAIQSAKAPPVFGVHGFPPQVPQMAALLLAVGRGAPAGVDLGELHSVDVAPTVLRLLGLEVPDTMEGRPIERLLPRAQAGAAAADAPR